MKKISSIIAMVLLAAMLCMSCSQYVCPAYSKEMPKEQAEESVRG